MKSVAMYITEAIKDEKQCSIIDNLLNNNDSSNKENEDMFDKIIKPNGPMIYAFITDKVKDAIKIGYTDQHPLKRISQWKEIYGKEKGEVECLGYWSAEEYNKAGERVFFWDHEVHKKVEKKGYKNIKKDDFQNFLTDKVEDPINLHYSNEFFRKYKELLNGETTDEEKEELSEKLIEDLLKEMREAIKRGDQDFKTFKVSVEGKKTSSKGSIVWKSPDTYSNTDLQEEAIDNGIKAINDGKKNILMAAVMRFGKTHAAYEIIKRAGLKRVIVTSGKADVREAWRVDINHKDFYKDFLFVEIDNEYNMTLTKLGNNDRLVTEQINVYKDTNIFELYKDKTIIIFATLADLGGSVKALKKKHAKVFSEKFDMMVVDETHYGSHGNLWKDVTKSSRNMIDIDEIADTEEEMKEMEKDNNMLNKLDIDFDVKLQVSGTPYYILASNEMLDENAAIISKVSYTDMIKARDDWNNKHQHEAKSNSPYFGIPTLHKIGLNLNKECRDALKKSKETDSLTALFEMQGSNFKYEKAIKSLMKGIFGDGSERTLSLLKSKKVEGNKVCKHTVLVLPRIKACDAMKDLLEKIIDTKERKIIKVVGNHPDVSNVKELNDKLYELDDNNKKSIILTVNKFLTGVSMPCVDSMIYLKSAKSPQEYDQNIFRLCTRNVRKVENAEGNEPKVVNMKDNVYLIDFNIANMFNMLANSARMKALAEDDPRPETVRKYMEQDIDAVPIFCEGQGEIMGKMREITSKDLMKTYTGYNANKSVADICNDEINLFDGLFGMKNFQKLIDEYDIEGDKSNIKIGDQEDGTDEISVSGEKSLKNNVKKNIGDIKDKLNVEKITKEKFKAIVKSIMYCNLCLDEPYTDIESLIKDSKSNKELSDSLKDFKLNGDKIEKIYDIMSTKYKELFNQLLTKICLLVDDIKHSKNGTDKYLEALRGLGRLGKSEVITPPEIVEKMIDKLDKSDYEKADSILLVNEKQGEFLYGLNKEFGKDIAKKCKIIPSSMIGKNLTVKLLKSLGLNDYINKVIIDLEDYDKSGEIDVKDFLKMNNEDILKENNGKKFDIVLMNPPYSGNDSVRSIKGEYSIESDFVNKLNKISNNVIAIYPFSRWQKREKLSKENSISGHLVELELFDANKIFNLHCQWKYVSIYLYDNTKINKYTTIKLNNKTYKIETYNNYENIKETFNKLNNEYYDLTPIINKLLPLYNKLNEKYKTMVNDGHGFIYEENRFKHASNYGVNRKEKIQTKLERVKNYLKEGKYKYCIYTGSYNNLHNKISEWNGEDPDKLFKGQVCWLTNKENVKNNIKYWMDSPLFNLWKRYYNQSNVVADGNFGLLPALDFEMNEEDFKEYVDSLNDFTKDEIKELKKFNVHNADKL